MDASLSQMLIDLVEQSNQCRVGAESLAASLIPTLDIKPGDTLALGDGRSMRVETIRFEFAAYGEGRNWHAGFSVVGPLWIGRNTPGTTRMRAVLNLKGERVK